MYWDNWIFAKFLSGQLLQTTSNYFVVGVALFFNWFIEGRFDHSSTRLLFIWKLNFWFREPNARIVELESFNLYPPILTQFFLVFIYFDCVEVALIVDAYFMIFRSIHNLVERIEEALLDSLSNLCWFVWYILPIVILFVALKLLICGCRLVPILQNPTKHLACNEVRLPIDCSCQSTKNIF